MIGKKHIFCSMSTLMFSPDKTYLVCLGNNYFFCLTCYKNDNKLVETWLEFGVNVDTYLYKECTGVEYGKVVAL